MDENTSKDAGEKQPIPSHYIAVGASAGGLEALQNFFQHMPTQLGASIIIVQHLSPDYKSMMLEILAKHTAMEIFNVVDGVEVRPNKIYMLPPKKNMVMVEGHLCLSDKMPNTGLNLPINIFFKSLAEDQRQKAIGIILSGTGSDGSSGIKAIKEYGGLVIAQEPESAKFDGMPISAINTGVVDFVVPPQEMGDKLLSYINRPLATVFEPSVHAGLYGNDDTLKEIFSLLKKKCEIDFSKYKPTTVLRRIERRMTIRQIATLKDYLRVLFKEPLELKFLNQDILIGVTRFFRDDKAFKKLQELIIPNIVKNSSPDKSIRVWAAGCSTGEEAYSIAILFAEALASQGIHREVKIFATDVNANSISQASAGLYNPDIVDDVDKHYLSSYFKPMNQYFQVNDKIRSMVIFAVHNLMNDPPFSNMDLVTCRNVLIYFKHEMQKKVLAILHFALRKDGYLFLGSSESLADLALYFDNIDDRNRLYHKLGDDRVPLGASSANNPSLHNEDRIPSVSHLMKGYRNAGGPSSVMGFANQYLIAQYVPPCILLNDDFEAIHVYGDISPYVRRFPPGKVSINIIDMINDDMSVAFSSALRRAQNINEEVYYAGVCTKLDTGNKGINLRVKYLKEFQKDTAPGYYWVVMESAEEHKVPFAENQLPFDEAEHFRQRVADLELELKRSKEHLQVTVEELESTNEELQSANEELMSANEELQSMNEELQSVNEELYTVNSEFQEKLVEVSQLSKDMDQVLALSRIGIIFLDENMQITRFTPSISKYINLIDGDINRPLHHFSKNMNYDSLITDLSKVYTTGKPVENEAVLIGGQEIRVNIYPHYYGETALAMGATITFSEKSKIKKYEEGLLDTYNHLRTSNNNTLDLLDTRAFQKSIDVLIVENNNADSLVLEGEFKGIKEYSVNFQSVIDIKAAVDLALKNNFDICLIYYDFEGGLEKLIDAFKAVGIHMPLLVFSLDPTKSLDARLLSLGIIDVVSEENLLSAAIAKTMRYAIRQQQIDAQAEQALVKSTKVLDLSSTT